MSKEETLEIGREGEEFHDMGGNDKIVQDLSILLTVTGRHENVLPVGCMTTANLARLIQEKTGVLPYQISILSDREALIEFEQGSPVVEISQIMHGAGKWGELDVEIGCVMSGRASLLNIHREKEYQKIQQEEVRNQVQSIKREQESYRSQLAEVVQGLHEKIKVMEKNSREGVAPTTSVPYGMAPRMDEKGNVVYKISKAPDLPNFSGTEPVPREEGSFEQWIFQVKGSQTQHTEDAIRSGIINSVRGEARDLVEYVGFGAPLGTILERLEHRFRKTRSTDRLQYEFFQLGQERTEGVQQYAGRLENHYKKLKAVFPERYGGAQLKERLYFGMIPGLRNATRYLFKQDDTTYEELLDAAKEAELEFTESKGASARLKAVGVVDKNENSKIQELNNRIENLTATLKANNVKPKSASAPCSPVKKSSERGGVPKMKGPEITSHGPFRQGKKPLQCYRCGGWGHGWRECPSPGNIDWRRLQGDEPPPEGKEAPNNTS